MQITAIDIIGQQINSGDYVLYKTEKTLYGSSLCLALVKDIIIKEVCGRKEPGFTTEFTIKTDLLENKSFINSLTCFNKPYKVKKIYLAGCIKISTEAAQNYINSVHSLYISFKEKSNE